MHRIADGNAELQDMIRSVQSFYMAKYPTSTDSVVYASAKALIEFCNKDLDYIEKSIMTLPDKTQDGKIPPFNYVSTSVRNLYKTKVDPKPKYTEQQLIDMCYNELSHHDRMTIDISSAIPAEYIGDEKITGFDDPNLVKMIDGWLEDGKIDQWWHDHSIKGIKIVLEDRILEHHIIKPLANDDSNKQEKDSNIQTNDNISFN